MYKLIVLLACLTYLCPNISTSADTPRSKSESGSGKLQFKITRKVTLTCENYEDFCDGPESEALKPADSCKRWISVLVCRNGTKTEVGAAIDKISQKLREHDRQEADADVEITHDSGSAIFKKHLET